MAGSHRCTFTCLYNQSVILVPCPLERQLAVHSLCDSQIWTPLDCLLGSLINSFFESLHERATHWEKLSFAQEAFGRWQNLHEWKLWLIDSLQSVEDLAN